MDAIDFNKLTSKERHVIMYVNMAPDLASVALNEMVQIRDDRIVEANHGLAIKIWLYLAQ